MEAVETLGLPPGFHFDPDDEEVIEYYLLPALQGQRFPGDCPVLVDDPLSAPPWELLARHGKEEDAFFFALGQPKNSRGSYQKRTCAGGGLWEGQKKVATGEKLRVPGMEVEVVWRKSALNFHEDGVDGSTGWVMHEYAVTAPPDLAASQLRVYRIRNSGYGKNAKKRKIRTPTQLTPRPVLGWQRLF